MSIGKDGAVTLAYQMEMNVRKNGKKGRVVDYDPKKPDSSEEWRKVG